MKKFIVFGLGISGSAAVKFLLQNNFKVLVGDDNEQSLANLKQNLKNDKISTDNLQIIDNFAQINWQNYDCLIFSAGIPLKYPKPHQIAILANQNNCPIVCDVEILYLLNNHADFIGITGTNGKSTTTALISYIFNLSGKISATGGNIGMASLSLPALKESENYILEMSSYQLDLIDKTRFHIASLLNITPDHIDRHKDLAGYILAKKRIFLNQKQEDFALIGIDNENSRLVYEQLKTDPNFNAKLVAISNKKICFDDFSLGVSLIDNVIYSNLSGKKTEINLGERQFLKGEHNSQNIAFAFANCFLSGIDEQQIIQGIKSFKGLKHRMQFVAKIDNINFINDSKATNAESSENALKCYENIYWILGGKPKEGGIEILHPYFSKIKASFLIGEATEEFVKTFEQKFAQNPKDKFEYFKCGNLENAFEMAFKMAFDKTKKDNLLETSQIDGRKEKNILLSPSCASFDQWKNFEQRGDFFCNLVENKVNINKINQ